MMVQILKELVATRTGSQQQQVAVPEEKVDQAANVPSRDLSVLIAKLDQQEKSLLELKSLLEGFRSDKIDQMEAPMNVKEQLAQAIQEGMSTFQEKIVHCLTNALDKVGVLNLRHCILLVLGTD
jgi:hypothetical protein